jgi:hypothetical protein
MALTKPKPSAEPAGEDESRLAGLERRVTRLETLAGTRVRTQEEDDEDILSRQPNSYPEAVRYQEALERRKAREKSGRAGATGPVSDGG